jgi:hypothetical protein
MDHPEPHEPTEWHASPLTEAEHPVASGTLARRKGGHRLADSWSGLPGQACASSR